MMNNFKQECKICDNIISDGNFKVIEDVVKDIYDIHLLQLIQTLNDTQAVMCMTCSSKLTAALNFKSTCHHTDNTIIPYVDFKNPKPVDLKQIYAKEKGSKQGGSMLEDREVCRLCLQPISDNYKLIQEVSIENIQIYIPEINFEVTTNPLICLKCHDALHVHSTFIKNCLDVDKNINWDAMNGRDTLLNDQCLKTEEMEIKSEETEEETLFEAVYIKEEEHIEGHTSFQSQTELTHTEDSKSLYELDHRKCTSAQSTFANNQSEECSFPTTSENRSADHERRHKRASEAQANKSECRNRNSKRGCLTDLKVQEYKCDKCTYNTKHKHNFMHHQIIHKDPSEVQIYKCDKCTFITKHKGNLIQHSLTHRDPAEVLVFHCDECDYKSKQRSHLKRHQLIHKHPSEARVFKCDECDYKSIQKGHLLTHQLRHKDPAQVKMFKCDKCNFETKHKNYLIQHCLRHKDPSEVKMFRCDECTFETKYRSNLIQHCLRHKDPAEVKMYKCDKCKFETKHNSNFINHCLRHKKRKAFKCDECDFESIQKSQLKRHQLTHINPSGVQM